MRHGAFKIHPMHRFSNIVFVPLAKRNNPAAVRRVAELAERNKAELTVLGVVAEPSRWQRLLDQPQLDQAIQQAEQGKLVERLEQACEDIGYEGAKHVIETGSPATVIIEQVLKGGHDLVVVTSDEDREDHATIKRLLRACPCPVWVIRPSRARTLRVLAAVDPEPGHLELNRQVLALAGSLHLLYGGELHVAHGWQLEGEATMRNSAFTRLAPAEIDRLVAEEQQRHRAALDGLISTQDVEADWITHLVKGRPADVITELVADRRINLLVMGTVARAGFSGWLLGNTAELLLDEVSCSVVAVKPPDFVSPVALPA